VRTSRLEAFSDGVLAIIITIMVLEQKEPDGKDFAALWHTTGTGLLSYLLSFVYVGIYWNNHHHMFQLTTRVNGGVLWANLGLLFCLSLFPFTTAWTESSGYARTPVVVYGLNLMLAAIAYYILQSVIIRSQGKDSPLRNALGRDLKGKVSPAFYIAGILSATLGGAGAGPGRVGIWFAIGFFVAVAIMWVVPDQRIDRAVRDQGTPDLHRPSPAPGTRPATPQKSVYPERIMATPHPLGHSPAHLRPPWRGLGAFTDQGLSSLAIPRESWPAVHRGQQ
jgi:uncharacterized membrane protein